MRKPDLKILVMLLFLCSFIAIQTFSYPSSVHANDQNPNNLVEKEFETNQILEQKVNDVIKIPSNSPKSIYYQDQIAVLIYHHLDEAEGTEVTISPAKFAEHLKMLREKDYRVISIEQMKGWMEGKIDIPANAVVITFDDGYESYYTYAYPELKKMGMHATHFLIVGRINQEPLPNEKKKLSWKQIDEMKKDGYSFYSHTYNLHRYVQSNQNGDQGPALTTPEFNTEQNQVESKESFHRKVGNDLLLAKNMLKLKLGFEHTETIFSYPYGAYHDETINTLKELGYEMMVTTKAGLNDRSTPLTQIKRINAGSPHITAEKLHETILSFTRK